MCVCVCVCGWVGGCVCVCKSYSDISRLIHVAIIRRYTQGSCVILRIITLVKVRVRTFQSTECSPDVYATILYTELSTYEYTLS